MRNIYFDAPFQFKNLNEHYVSIGSIFYKLQLPEIVIFNSIFLFNRLKIKNLDSFIIALILSSKLLMDIPLPYETLFQLLNYRIENIVRAEQEIWKELNFKLLGSKRDYEIIQIAIEKNKKYYRLKDKILIYIKRIFR